MIRLPRFEPRPGAAIAIVSVLFALGLLVSCSTREAPDEKSMNVLVVTFDTLRADHTSLVDAEKGTTPNIVRLASSGVEFSTAYAPSSTTGPSHASLFTGLYPAWHAVTKNGLALDDRHVTMAEWFREQGYRTAGFVSSYVLNRRFGFDRGFEFYSDDFPDDSGTLVLDEWEGHEITTVFDRRAEQTTDAAIEWLRTSQGDERPFLLFVHYFDPHAPYDPPDEYAERFGADRAQPSDRGEESKRYDGEIAFADHELGRLLDTLEALGTFDETTILVTSDHGEGLMDHGVKEHGALIHEPFVHVPLVVRLAGGRRDALRIEEPVSLVDLFPTIQSLAVPGVVDAKRTVESETEPGRGRDLSAFLAAEVEVEAEVAGETSVYLHRRPYAAGRVDDVFVEGERYAVRRGEWKYFGAGDGQGPALFDLRRDPGETRNRVADYPEIADRLKADLDHWMSSFPRSEPHRIRPEVRQALEAMGYVD